jgi:hypothetical protein
LGGHGVVYIEEIRGFFERREREGYAENAKEDKEKDTKI